MPDDNFDFGGHIEDDTDVSPRRYTNDDEECLSPYGLLVARVGLARGREIFNSFVRIANKAAEEHGGVPGIAFDVDGGRFVAINEPANEH